MLPVATKARGGGGLGLALELGVGVGWLDVAEPAGLRTAEVAGAGLVGVPAQPAIANAAAKPAASVRQD